MNEIYFIADMHFGHDNALKWKDSGRGGLFNSIEEHDNYIVEQWNKIVNKRDVVYVLGDVALNQKGLKSLRKLRGIKHLIMGNHDRFLRTDHVYLFNKINGSLSYKYDFLLTHVPVHPRSIRPRFFANIHGHTHQHEPYGEEYFNVSVERINYTPIHFDLIIEALKYKENWRKNRC